MSLHSEYLPDGKIRRGRWIDRRHSGNVACGPVKWLIEICGMTDLRLIRNATFDDRTYGMPPKKKTGDANPPSTGTTQDAMAEASGIRANKKAKAAAASTDENAPKKRKKATKADKSMKTGDEGGDEDDERIPTLSLPASELARVAKAREVREEELESFLEAEEKCLIGYTFLPVDEDDRGDFPILLRFFNPRELNQGMVDALADEMERSKWEWNGGEIPIGVYPETLDPDCYFKTPADRTTGKVVKLLPNSLPLYEKYGKKIPLPGGQHRIAASCKLYKKNVVALKASMAQKKKLEKCRLEDGSWPATALDRKEEWEDVEKACKTLEKSVAKYRFFGAKLYDLHKLEAIDGMLMFLSRNDHRWTYEDSEDNRVRMAAMRIVELEGQRMKALRGEGDPRQAAVARKALDKTVNQLIDDLASHKNTKQVSKLMTDKAVRQWLCVIVEMPHLQQSHSLLSADGIRSVMERTVGPIIHRELYYAARLYKHIFLPPAPCITNRSMGEIARFAALLHTSHCDSVWGDRANRFRLIFWDDPLVDDPIRDILKPAAQEEEMLFLHTQAKQKANRMKVAKEHAAAQAKVAREKAEQQLKLKEVDGGETSNDEDEDEEEDEDNNCLLDDNQPPDGVEVDIRAAMMRHGDSVNMMFDTFFGQGKSKKSKGKAKETDDDSTDPKATCAESQPQERAFALYGSMLLFATPEWQGYALAVIQKVLLFWHESLHGVADDVFQDKVFRKAAADVIAKSQGNPWRETTPGTPEAEEEDGEIGEVDQAHDTDQENRLRKRKEREEAEAARHREEQERKAREAAEQAAKEESAKEAAKASSQGNKKPKPRRKVKITLDEEEEPSLAIPDHTVLSKVFDGKINTWRFLSPDARGPLGDYDGPLTLLKTRMDQVASQTRSKAFRDMMYEFQITFQIARSLSKDEDKVQLHDVFKHVFTCMMIPHHFRPQTSAPILPSLSFIRALQDLLDPGEPGITEIFRWLDPAYDEMKVHTYGLKFSRAAGAAKSIERRGLWKGSAPKYLFSHFVEYLQEIFSEVVLPLSPFLISNKVPKKWKSDGGFKTFEKTAGIMVFTKDAKVFEPQETGRSVRGDMYLLEDLPHRPATQDEAELARVLAQHADERARTFGDHMVIDELRRENREINSYEFAFQVSSWDTNPKQNNPRLQLRIIFAALMIAYKHNWKYRRGDFHFNTPEIIIARHFIEYFFHRLTSRKSFRFCDGLNLDEEKIRWLASSSRNESGVTVAQRLNNMAVVSKREGWVQNIVNMIQRDSIAMAGEGLNFLLRQKLVELVDVLKALDTADRAISLNLVTEDNVVPLQVSLLNELQVTIPDAGQDTANNRLVEYILQERSDKHGVVRPLVAKPTTTKAGSVSSNLKSQEQVARGLEQTLTPADPPPGRAADHDVIEGSLNLSHGVYHESSSGDACGVPGDTELSQVNEESTQDSVLSSIVDNTSQPEPPFTQSQDSSDVESSNNDLFCEPEDGRADPGLKDLDVELISNNDIPKTMFS
ncbi:hypothetical protein K474DRAFT_1680751, partial [Panus rudis PR-1116 ss-1]